MKKVLIAITHIPPIAGGAERAAWEIAMRLKSRFEIHLLTIGKDNTSELRDGVTIHYVRYRYPLSLYYSTVGKRYIYRLLEKHDFDLINIHMVLPWGYILKDFPVQKVISDHFISFYIYKRRWLFNLVERYAVKQAFAHASAVTSVSRYITEKISDDFSISVSHIPNGIDLDRFQADRGEEEHNVILFVGRFIELKGLRYLLQAAGELPMYEFWFAGMGPLDNMIKGDNVKNLGFTERPEDIMRRAALCIFPSLSETSPLVGLEAMACGKAVVATYPGFSEYIEDGKDGYLIEPKSVEAIVSSIKILMNDEGLRRSLGGNARKKAELYSWDLISRRYADTYNKTIEGN